MQDGQQDGGATATHEGQTQQEGGERRKLEGKVVHVRAKDEQGKDLEKPVAEIRFQNGFQKLEGRNGATVEEVLATCQDRIKELDAGLSCDENQAAMSDIGSAISALESRKHKRQKQQVWGTSKKHDS